MTHSYNILDLHLGARPLSIRPNFWIGNHYIWFQSMSDGEIEYTASDTIAAENAKARTGGTLRLRIANSRTPLPALRTYQFGSFKAPQFGTISSAKAKMTANTPTRQNPQAETETNSTPLQGTERQSQATTKANKSAKVTAKKATKKNRPITNLACLLADYDKNQTQLILAQEELRKYKGRNNDLTVRNTDLENNLTTMRDQRDEARGRLHTADTEIIRLNGYISGMQNLAEINGEPSAENNTSARVTPEVTHSERPRSQHDNSETANDLHDERPSFTTHQDQRRIPTPTLIHNQLKKPSIKPWGGTKDCDNVTIFLDRLERYLTTHYISQDDMPHQALDVRGLR